MAEDGQLDTDGSGYYFVPLSADPLVSPPLDPRDTPHVPAVPGVPEREDPQLRDTPRDSHEGHVSLETPPLTRDGDTRDTRDTKCPSPLSLTPDPRDTPRDTSGTPLQSGPEGDLR